MNVIPRRMLLLQDPSSLSREELWLREAYATIVSNLMRFATDPSSTFDPFSSKFMGLEAVESNKHEFRAFMEVTSYFWGSKGGRGALLEKVVAAAGGITAANGLHLSKIPDWIASVKKMKEVSEWKVTGSAPQLKFDLINVIDDRLIFLEIKNRVDSGGTAAREEALAKKFLKLCELIQNGERIYVGDRVEMDIAQTLLGLGIKKVEMHAGFLFNVNGNEASINDDRSNGFYTQSKRLLENYFKKQNHRFSVKLAYDESLQRLSFEKDGLIVVVDLLYGSDVTRNFTHEKLNLNSILNKVFTRRWDDIWLSLNLAVSQRSILLKQGNNIFSNLQELLSVQKDRRFADYFDKFVANPDDPKKLAACVEAIKRCNMIVSYSARTSSDVDLSDEEIADCIYTYAASCGQRKKVKSLVKV
jgi:hypothetical protein